MNNKETFCIGGSCMFGSHRQCDTFDCSCPCHDKKENLN